MVGRKGVYLCTQVIRPHVHLLQRIEFKSICEFITQPQFGRLQAEHILVEKHPIRPQKHTVYVMRSYYCFHIH